MVTPVTKDLILVVDDTPTQLAILSECLKKAGFQVAIETDGESAIAQVAYNPPDLILLDVHMPGMNGVESCLQLKLNPESQDIPVILMTAVGETTDKGKGFAIGAVDYLTKPFHPQEVIARVKTHLQLRKLSLTLQEKDKILTEAMQKTVEAQKQLRQTREQSKTRQQQILSQEKWASLGSLTAGIVHELKNPLNFINNFASVSLDFSKKLRAEIDALSNLIPEQKLGNLQTVVQHLQQSSDAIYQQGKQADLMIRSLLLHGRKDGGKLEMVDLNQLLEDNLQLALKSYKTSFPIFDLQVHCEYDPKIKRVKINPQSFSRALLKILNNGIEELYYYQNKLGKTFIPQLLISTHQGKKGIEITVKDNGSGIPDKLLTRVFDPFFTTKSPDQGIGLGLAIAHDIITHEHQGQITIETEIGEYTSFMVTLPLRN